MRELGSGLWHWTARHPDWTPGDGGPDGWGPEVSSYAHETPDQLVLFDPLVEDWEALDRLAGDRPVAVLRTVQWHGRSSQAIAERYDVSDDPRPGVQAILLKSVGGEHETLYWLEEPRALVTGDGILGGDDGILLCPESWVGEGGLDELREQLRPLLDLPVERVLVTHGEPLLEGGHAALERLLVGP